MDYSTKELEGSQTMNYEIIMFVKNRSGNLAIQDRKYMQNITYILKFTEHFALRRFLTV